MIMLLPKLRKSIAFAEKIFVWVSLHPQDGVWLQIPKSVIFDYIQESLDTDEFIATLVDEELFLGHDHENI